LTIYRSSSKVKDYSHGIKKVVDVKSSKGSLVWWSNKFVSGKVVNITCLTRFQRIQNSVARILLQRPSLSSRDTLQHLHWFPVKWRIQIKLASLTTKSYTLVLHHICLNAFIPTFLLAPCDHPPPLYCTSPTNLYFGSRSFHIAAPTVWNFNLFPDRIS